MNPSHAGSLPLGASFFSYRDIELGLCDIYEFIVCFRLDLDLPELLPQPARISVTVSGGTSSISSVRLTNLSTANGNPGEIIAHDAGSGIYEALVTPQSVTQGTAFVTIATTDGKTYVYRMKQDADWDAGVEHKYEISIK
ncbi:fimbrillin family protein [Bacteroides sp. ET71]|uniref:fimbrillin family protein n=1 Tax=Bacteroides sp. ET71 TaxID=2939421 RepID=UPI002012BBDE|nr:fimbrillin family protein [Bacteroides sp. ET71]MCL1617152.1 fimbrillin family protein [Bacteroides sp. ET71]